MLGNNSRSPWEVTLGVWLNVASLLLGVMKGVLLPIPGPLWIAITSLTVVAALTAAVAWGHNWARVTLLVMFLLGLPLTSRG